MVSAPELRNTSVVRRWKTSLLCMGTVGAEWRSSAFPSPNKLHTDPLSKMARVSIGRHSTRKEQIRLWRPSNHKPLQSQQLCCATLATQPRRSQRLTKLWSCGHILQLPPVEVSLGRCPASPNRLRTSQSCNKAVLQDVSITSYLNSFGPLALIRLGELIVY